MDYITQFKESVPLIEQLKKPSIKKQHWKKLIALTGKEVEFDVKSISLEQVFSLELHKHKDEVDEICQEASEE